MKKFLLIFTFLISLAVKAEEEKRVCQNAFSTTFLSWFTGSVKLYYERAFDQHNAIQSAVGIIGVMMDGRHNDPKGLHLRTGYKYNFALTREAKPLQGFYVKPELLFSTFEYDEKETKIRKRSTMGTLMANIGFQYIWNRFVVDGYWGIGYAVGNEADTWYQHGFMLLDMLGMKSKDISLGAGMKLGFCF